MTEPKPPGISWGSWIDQQIRQAREVGLFDSLPGDGDGLAARRRGQGQISNPGAEPRDCHGERAGNRGPATGLGPLDVEAIVGKRRARRKPG
jgi:Domain of unknown function (DUF1992)